MLAKIYNTPGNRLMVAVCDKDLLGKKFAEKGLQLDLSTGFYDGKVLPEKEIVELMKRSHVINVVGKRSVKLAVQSGVVDKANVKKVCAVPHAQSFVL